MKILIADDDLALTTSLRAWLESEKFYVDTASDGKIALQYLNASAYDLIILDWKMPVFSGIEVCKRYRQEGGKAFVLMLTGQASLDEKVTGLDTGADDYVTKPFSTPELLARIKSLLRRPLNFSAQILEVDSLSLNRETRELSYNKSVVKLLPFEMIILECFLQSKGQLFSQEHLREKVEEKLEKASLQSIRSSVSRLKKKLSELGLEDVIISEPGGYRYK